MPEVSIDWVAIIVAVVVSMIVSAVWYAPPLFGRQWVGLVGKTQDELRSGAGMGYLVAVFGALVSAIVLTYVTQWAAADDFWEGAAVGAIAWLGFTATTIVLHGVFEQRPWGLMMINAGSLLVTLMLTGGIVAAMA